MKPGHIDDWNGTDYFREILNEAAGHGAGPGVDLFVKASSVLLAGPKLAFMANDGVGHQPSNGTMLRESRVMLSITWRIGSPLMLQSLTLRVVASVMVMLMVVVMGCEKSAPTSPRQVDAAGPVPPAPPSRDATVLSQPSVEQPDISPKRPDIPALLGIGSPAPSLSIAQWMTGESFESFQPGQVYVVEFWATWCPPCRTSMPHLSQLQQKYGDEVKFVGVTREPEETVRKFLDQEQSPGKTWVEVIQYRLAIDSADATSVAYMNAAQQTGIPTAFIVGRDAVVEWIGHPMMMDDPLEKVVAGAWDRQAAVAQFQQQQKLKQISRELSAKVRNQEWDAALGMLEQLEQETVSSIELSQMRFSVLQMAGRKEEAAKLQAEMVDQAWDSAAALNEIAWSIASSEEQGDLELAFKAAQRASELQNHQDAAVLDTLARVYYEKGQLDEAIEWQKKAVEHNQGNPSIEAILKKYESEKANQSGGSNPPDGGAKQQ